MLSLASRHACRFIHMSYMPLLIQTLNKSDESLHSSVNLRAELYLKCCQLCNNQDEKYQYHNI